MRTQIKEYLRQLEHNPNSELLLTPLSSDIWFTDYDVEEHTDNTEKGKDTVICVLLNDAKADFYHGNKKYELYEGKIIRFDGNIKHCLTCKQKGRSAFLIWDVPVDKQMEECEIEIHERLSEIYNMVIQGKDII